MVQVKDQEIVEDFESCLEWLKSSDPWEISELTTIAKNLVNYYAAELVVGLQQHIANVPPKLKLPGLYLLDSMVKNASSVYADLFAEELVNIFSCVFMAVDSKTKRLMFHLRKTWNEIFSSAVLYDLDYKIKSIDDNWPIIIATPPSPGVAGSACSSASSPTDKSTVGSLVDKSPDIPPIDDLHVRSPMENPSATSYVDPTLVTDDLTAGQSQVLADVFNQHIMSFEFFPTDHAAFSEGQSVDTNMQPIESKVSVDEKTPQEFSHDEFLSDSRSLNLSGDDACPLTVNKRKRSDSFTEEDSKKSRTDSWQ